MARKPHLSEALDGARRRTDELFGLLAPMRSTIAPSPNGIAMFSTWAIWKPSTEI